MTFVEAAVAVLRQHGRPLHYKKLVEMALRQQLLTHAGRTPEETMQTQLALAIKRAPDRSPFVDAGNGVFGLRSYPSKEEAAAEKAAAKAVEKEAEKPAPAEKGRRGKGREVAEAAGGKRRRGRGAKAAPEKSDEPAAVPVASPAPPPAEGRGGKRRRGRRRGEAEAPAREEAPVEAAPPAAPQAAPEPAASAAAPAAASASAPAPEGAEAAPAEATPPVPGKELVASVGSHVPGAPPLVMIRRGAGATPAAGEAAPAAAPEAAPPAVPAEAPRPQGPRPGGQDFRGGRPHERDQRREQQQGERREQQQGERRDQPPGERRPERMIDLSPADAAFEILRAQGDSRPLHARQILDMASKRRLTRIDTPEPWRALRAAVVADGRDRLANGLRPRFRMHGGGLYSMASRHLDSDLAAAERQVAERCEDLRKATRASVARLIAKLGMASFEQVVWLLLDRLGHREIALIRRSDRRAYLACVRAPHRLVAAVHLGNVDDGRQAVLDLRTEIQRIGGRAGMLFASGNVAESAVNEAREPGPPISLYDATQIAELCASRSLGVLRENIPVDYLDIEFFSDLLEG
jgi:hypothetical protein